MKFSLGVSKFIPKISSLSYSIVSSIFFFFGIKHTQYYTPIQCLSSDILQVIFNPLQKKFMW